MNNYYGKHAYNSSQPRTQAPQTELPHLGFAERLPWGHTPDRINSGLQNKGAIDFARREEQRLKKDFPNIPREKWSIHNHEYLQQGDYSKFSVFLNIIFASGKILAIPATICYFITMILIYFADKTTPIEQLKEEFLMYAIFFPGMLYYLWILGLLITKFCPQLLMLKGNGKIKWRINRRTGMVSQFTYPNKGEVIEKTAPFDEFDAYLCISVARHGFLYDFMLYHRYEGWLVGLEGQVPIKANKEPFQEEWEFIQNYMDTSKPLPEDPVLECYRHLDPVTVAYDKATDRNPHKLRDMTAEQWQAFYTDINQKALPMMEKRPCLFQEGGYVNYLPACHWPPTYK